VLIGAAEKALAGLQGDYSATKMEKRLILYLQVTKHFVYNQPSTIAQAQTLLPAPRSQHI
jgi:hypothetical protein